MENESPRREWLGPLAGPVGAIAAALGLIGTFKTNADVLGWKIATGTGFLVALGWAIWYAFAKTTLPPTIVGAPARRALVHPARSRLIAFGLPFGILIAGCLLWAYHSEPDYSDMFTGGGAVPPPIVVFDSKPRGADVKFARIIYGEDDPLLLGCTRTMRAVFTRLGRHCV